MLDELDDLLRSTRDWLAEGHKVAIATVIETWGSAPRRRGSHAIIRDDGLFEGSVSGGCVEGDVIVGAQALIRNGGGFERRDYGVQDENAWTFGLACGGKISVVIQTVDPGHYPPALIDKVIERRGQGQAVSVVTDLVSGASHEGQASGEEAYVNLYPPPLRMMIVGAVHVSQSLVPRASLATSCSSSIHATASPLPIDLPVWKSTRAGPTRRSPNGSPMAAPRSSR